MKKNIIPTANVAFRNSLETAIGWSAKQRVTLFTSLNTKEDTEHIQCLQMFLIALQRSTPIKRKTDRGFADS